jgi:hypothetical protein
MASPPIFTTKAPPLCAAATASIVFETAPDTLSGAVSIRREFQHAGTEALASKILPVPGHIKLDARKRSDKAKHLPSLWTCTSPSGPRGPAPIPEPPAPSIN